MTSFDPPETLEEKDVKLFYNYPTSELDMW